MDILQQKYRELKDRLAKLESVAVAFSGGVDSTFLLKAAQEVLDAKVIALTADSLLVPRRDVLFAQAFCVEQGIRQVVVPFSPLNLPGVRENPPNRCYLCKYALFSRLREIAAQNDAILIEGSNVDDEADYRPGKKAISELGVRSPLAEARLYKEEIRALSKILGLDGEKPSSACLASRIPYGEAVTEEKLALVERSEEFLSGMGFPGVRVRVQAQGQLARIEVAPEFFSKLVAASGSIVKNFKEWGFLYITLDLEGYRTGSLNSSLAK